MSEITLQSRIAKRAEIISGQIDDELIMMSIENGKYHTLNSTAGRIWTLLDTPQSVSELCATLTGEFNVAPAIIQKEVMDFINQLAIREIVTIE